jgi:hypothetical protein
MIDINYQKRKNTELFKVLEDSKSLFLSNTQNYIPIYNRFFSLNDTNYNNINLNHKWYIYNVKQSLEYSNNLYNCRLKNINNNKVKDKDVFFKMAPLLDPFKYLIGKYDINDANLFNLPELNSTNETCGKKILDINNSAYVDGFFLYLISSLLNNHSFIHGIDYYGSFLAIKNNFVLNIYDDIEYLNESDFFNKNKNVLFKVDNYDHLLYDESNPFNNGKLKPINIQHNSSIKSSISIKSFDDNIFENIFENNINSKSSINLSDLKDLSIELVDITNNDSSNTKNENKSFTLKSNSTCSSRTSHTTAENMVNDENNKSNDIDDSTIKSSIETSSNTNSEESYEDQEEKLNAIIPKFPVNVICMESCENTFDELILNNDLEPNEWYSAFMQIIMILITYQKAFNFTHNDLHTNNVMYNYTDKKYIYYCYKKKYYKVPTYGRLFKIIDFGRSIYKFKGALFCSDSFQIGGDAVTQYNTEPYFNSKKPRLDPNFSFDLCRLACSIFDYIIDDLNEIKDLNKCKDPIKKLVVEWCLDDKGINMLYKNDGTDRYPDFKLYKMIARCVHNHTPQAQLERPEFKAFTNFKGELPNPNDVIDIDNIPVYI